MMAKKFAHKTWNRSNDNLLILLNSLDELYKEADDKVRGKTEERDMIQGK